MSTATALAPALTAVSREHRFLFDLQGFVHLRGVLSPTECGELLAGVRRIESATYDDAWRDRLPTGQREQALPTRHRWNGGLRMNGLLRLDPAFDRLIDHPVLLPYLREFVRRPQLVNTWSIAKRAAPDSVGWHRGLSPMRTWCREGVVRTEMLNVVWMLTDNGPDDGCMCVVPASHKSGIAAYSGYDGPPPLAGGADFDFGAYRGLDLPGSIPVIGRAGDALVMSEALLHGGLVKTSDGVRTNLYFNHLGGDGSVSDLEPFNMRHFYVPDRLRARFTPPRRELTRWMDWTRADES